MPNTPGLYLRRSSNQQSRTVFVFGINGQLWVTTHRGGLLLTAFEKWQHELNGPGSYTRIS